MPRDPIAALFSYGEAADDLPDYIDELGFHSSHIPELIRLATDPELLHADEDTDDAWVPMHAWRVLTQLKAQDAVEPLLALFELKDHPWVYTEMVEVYANFGAMAIAPLSTYLHSSSHSDDARNLAAECLGHIPEHHPNVQERCALALMQQLESYQEQSSVLNTILIDQLADLAYAKAMPLVRDVFDAGMVDAPRGEDWERVRQDLEAELPWEETTLYQELHTSYDTPVNALLSLGEPQGNHPDEWPLVAEELGLGPDHIPELLRLSTDTHVLYAGEPDVYAFVHAWRILAQMHAEAAIEPFLQLLDWDSDWVTEELASVYALLGPAAIPFLSTYLADASQSEDGRDVTVSCLQEIATMHPDYRDPCVQVLTQQLMQYQTNSPDLNGALVCDLCDLHAQESAAVIKSAFDAFRVNLRMMGDWEEAAVELGVIPKRTKPKLVMPSPFQEPTYLIPRYQLPEAPSRKENKGQQRMAAKKSKQKMAKASRKKNRSKK